MAGETKSGYVQEMGRTKSGASAKLKINGTWTTVNNRSANIDGIQPGAYVEYQLGGFNGSDGKWIPTIDRIRPAQAPQGQPPGQGTAQAGSPVSRLKSASWDDSSMRFMSNLIGAAIMAGKIETPIQISDWALAAQDALLVLTGERPQRPAEGPGTGQSTPNSGNTDEGWDDLAPSATGREPGSDDW